MKKLLLTAIAALLLATGTAHANDNWLAKCGAQFFVVYCHHGCSFNRSDANGNEEGPEVPQRLFRLRVSGNGETFNETLFFRGRKCKYVPNDAFPKDLTPERNK
jgi:hypothetical protein